MSGVTLWLALSVVVVVAVIILFALRRRPDTLEGGGAVDLPPRPAFRPVPAVPVPAVSTTDELSRLWTLHQEGALTAEEFETQKARLLEGAGAVSAGGRQVVLTSAGRNKIAVIKRYRELTDCGLKEALDTVESAPVVVAQGLTDAQAAEIARNFQSDGATVEVR